jgi:hypothetical protein
MTAGTSWLHAIRATGSALPGAGIASVTVASAVAIKAVEDIRRRSTSSSPDSWSEHNRRTVVPNGSATPDP